MDFANHVVRPCKQYVVDQQLTVPADPDRDVLHVEREPHPFVAQIAPSRFQLFDVNRFVQRRSDRILGGDLYRRGCQQAHQPQKLSHVWILFVWGTDARQYRICPCDVHQRHGADLTHRLHSICSTTPTR